MIPRTDAPLTMFGRFLRWWQERAQQQQTLEELRAMGDTALAELSRDFGVSPDQLLELVARGPHSADELLLALTDFGIVPETAEHDAPHVFRDMQLACAMCDSKGRCRRDLKAHDLVRLADYCPNAPQLREMVAATHHAPGAGRLSARPEARDRPRPVWPRSAQLHA